MLGVLALVLLMSGVSQGSIVTDCNLKYDLEVAQFQQTDQLSVDEIIAMIVCDVENTSGFNTSLITTTNQDVVSPLLAVSLKEEEGSASQENIVVATAASQTEGSGIFNVWQELFQSGSGSGSGSGEPLVSESSGSSSEETKSVVSTLYGIFQLSDQVACDSGAGGALNLCGLECSALVDDDITDDIACLKTLSGNSAKLMSVQQCGSIVPSEYFASCS